MIRFPRILGLFSVVALLWLSVGLAHAEYILRLPDLPEMRFESVETENTPPPLKINAYRDGFDWTKNLNSQEKFPELHLPNSKEIFEKYLSRMWSVIRPKENVFVEVDIRSFSPKDHYQDHQVIFYTTRFGALVVNGKEILFSYSQIMIDKAYLGFINPYRQCFRDSTPLDWPSDEPRIYASLHLVIRGVLDRLETDEPFLWEGKVGSVRFMDVYLRDIEVLKIDCK